jgi:hypothetical protein
MRGAENWTLEYRRPAREIIWEIKIADCHMSKIV